MVGHGPVVVYIKLVAIVADWFELFPAREANVLDEKRFTNTNHQWLVNTTGPMSHFAFKRPQWTRLVPEQRSIERETRNVHGKGAPSHLRSPACDLGSHARAVAG